MKPLSGHYPQFNSSKIQSTSTTPFSSNSYNSINKNASKNNFTKPNQSTQANHNLHKKKQHFNINLKKSVNVSKQRISRSIQQLPYIQTDASMTSLFNARKPAFQTPQKSPQNSKNMGSSNTHTYSFSNLQAKNLNNKNEILIQNCEQDEEQLFSQSYKKINKMYLDFSNAKCQAGLQPNRNLGISSSKNLLKNNANRGPGLSKKNSIEQELVQILQLIKQQRSIIKQKFAQLQLIKAKKGCITMEASQNTQSIIISNQQREQNSKNYCQKEVQTQLVDKQIAGKRQNNGSNFKKQLSPKHQGQTNLQGQTRRIKNDVQRHVQRIESNETYSKLIKILQDMSINWRKILPQQIVLQTNTETKQQSSRNEGQTRIDEKAQKKYQQLKQSQIITVQKFVIKKLVQRISILQSNCSKTTSDSAANAAVADQTHHK